MKQSIKFISKTVIIFVNFWLVASCTLSAPKKDVYSIPKYSPELLKVYYQNNPPDQLKYSESHIETLGITEMNRLIISSVDFKNRIESNNYSEHINNNEVNRITGIYYSKQGTPSQGSGTSIKKGQDRIGSNESFGQVAESNNSRTSIKKGQDRIGSNETFDQAAPSKSSGTPTEKNQDRIGSNEPLDQAAPSKGSGTSIEKGRDRIGSNEPLDQAAPSKSSATSIEKGQDRIGSSEPLDQTAPSKSSGTSIEKNQARIVSNESLDQAVPSKDSGTSIDKGQGRIVSNEPLDQAAPSKNSGTSIDKGQERIVSNEPLDQAVPSKDSGKPIEKVQDTLLINATNDTDSQNTSKPNNSNNPRGVEHLFVASAAPTTETAMDGAGNAIHADRDNALLSSSVPLDSDRKDGSEKNFSHFLGSAGPGIYLLPPFLYALLFIVL